MGRGVEVAAKVSTGVVVDSGDGVAVGVGTPVHAANNTHITT